MNLGGKTGVNKGRGMEQTRKRYQKQLSEGYCFSKQKCISPPHFHVSWRFLACTLYTSIYYYYLIVRSLTTKESNKYLHNCKRERVGVNWYSVVQQNIKYKIMKREGVELFNQHQVGDDNGENILKTF